MIESISTHLLSLSLALLFFLMLLLSLDILCFSLAKLLLLDWLWIFHIELSWSTICSNFERGNFCCILCITRHNLAQYAGLVVMDSLLQSLDGLVVQVQVLVLLGEVFKLSSYLKFQLEFLVLALELFDLVLSQFVLLSLIFAISNDVLLHLDLHPLFVFLSSLLVQLLGRGDLVFKLLHFNFVLLVVSFILSSQLGNLFLFLDLPLFCTLEGVSGVLKEADSFSELLGQGLSVIGFNFEHI